MRFPFSSGGGLVRACLPSNSSRQQKTRAPKDFGRGQVPHTNVLTFSRQGTLPTRPLARWLAPRATSSGRPAETTFLGRSPARTSQGQVRVPFPHSLRGNSLRFVTNCSHRFIHKLRASRSQEKNDF